MGLLLSIKIKFHFRALYVQLYCARVHCFTVRLITLMGITAKSVNNIFENAFQNSEFEITCC